MTSLQLRLFGGFELIGAGASPLPTRKAEALLAYLAAAEGSTHRRDKLAALLWGDRGDAQARHSLAQTLYLIRKSFGEVADRTLIVDGQTVCLDRSRIEIDIQEFESLVAGQTPDQLQTAVKLYRGGFLEGFHVTTEGFEEWLGGEQRRLNELALSAFDRLLRYQTETSDDAGAIDTARRLLAIDPLQERVHRGLMRLYRDLGRDADAIRQFRVCAETLHRELDIGPEPETSRLHREIVDARTTVALDAEAPNMPAPRSCRPASGAERARAYVQRGNAYLESMTREDNVKAREMFLQAIELDEESMTAYAGLGRTLVHETRQGWATEPEATRTMAADSANPTNFMAALLGGAKRLFDALPRFQKQTETSLAARRERYYSRALAMPPSASFSWNMPRMPHREMSGRRMHYIY